MMRIWIILLCIVLILFCTYIFSGCLKSLQPTGPSVPYDPLNQIGQAVKGTNWLITISILATALSVVAVFNGSKIGLGALVGSITSLTVSLMVARYATVIAFIGLFFAVGVLIYSVVIKNKALFEIFKTTEKAKGLLSDSAQNDIFKGENSEANKLQGKVTKKIVNKLQLKVK